MQNIGFNQAKKMVTNSTFKKTIERIESCKILEVTDDYGEIHLLVGIKCIGMLADTVSYILTTPHSTSLVFCETKVPIQDIGGHRQLSLTRQCSCMYINSCYTEVLWFKSHPKMCLRCFCRFQDYKIFLLTKPDIGIVQSPLSLFCLI